MSVNQIHCDMWGSGVQSSSTCQELSYNMAGEFSYISQLYNFEVQFHSGVPLCEIWEEARITDIAVAHFSATSKVWDIPPDKVIFSNVNEYLKSTFLTFPLKTRANINLRWRSLHAEWQIVLSAALRHCKLKGMRQAAEYHSSAVFSAGR